MAGQTVQSLSETALAALPLFANVSADAHVAFARQGRLQRYQAGTVMFLQGDPPDAVYCILSGRVEITTTAAADGRIRLVAVLGPGDLLGELAVLGDIARSGSAICVADTTVWVVNSQGFRRFLTDHPPVALALLSSLARLVIAQNGVVDDMLFLDLRGRVAKRLLGLAKTGDAPPADGTVIEWGLPQADLAYLCGGTRANVSRVLAEFGRRRLIERVGRQYTLRDVKTLCRLAGI